MMESRNVSKYVFIMSKKSKKNATYVITIDVRENV